MSDAPISGAWSGHFQDPVFYGRLPFVLTLEDDGGMLTGHGVDPAGQFTVTGFFDDVQGRVTLTKAYGDDRRIGLNLLRVGDGLEGIWRMTEPQRRRGLVHLSRVPDEPALEAAREVAKKPASRFRNLGTVNLLAGFTLLPLAILGGMNFVPESVANGLAAVIIAGAVAGLAHQASIVLRARNDP